MKRKTIVKRYESNSDNYRKIDEKQQGKCGENQLVYLLLLIKLGEFILTDVLRDSDAMSFVHSSVVA